MFTVSSNFPGHPEVVYLRTFSLVSSRDASIVSISAGPNTVTFAMVPQLPDSLTVIFIEPVAPTLSTTWFT